MANPLPISTKLVYACKLCRIARGRCRQRGAPGHLAVSDEPQSVKRKRSGGGSKALIQIRIVSSSSGGASPVAAVKTQATAKATATLVLESCRRCKIAKGYCYNPGKEGHLAAEQCLPINTMPARGGGPRSRSSSTHTMPARKKEKVLRGQAIATYVHPLAVAVLDRPMVDYNDAGYWPKGYDLGSNSTTEWKSDAGNSGERASIGAKGRSGFVFASLMGWGGPQTGGR